MTTAISIQMLEEAINMARRECPTPAADHCLSADIKALAEIYGLLIFQGHSAFDAATLEPGTKDVLEHWLSRHQQAILKRAA
ncbi:MAG: DUF3717 domain-containing protein [Burkholderiaceae bacterium]